MQTVIPESVVRAYLITRPVITALVGTAPARVYATADLPAGYRPDVTGQALQLTSRAGSPHYSNTAVLVSIQARAWARDELTAWNLYKALVQELHEARNSQIILARLATTGQAIIDSETTWPFVLSFFDVAIRNTAA